MLSAVQTQQRKLLDLCSENKTWSLRTKLGFIIVSRNQSVAGVNAVAQKGAAPPKKFKVSQSTGNIMDTVFWKTDRILLIDFKEKVVIITEGYFGNLLDKSENAIREKRRGKWTWGVLLLHDNAPVHKSHVAMVALQTCGFRTLNHPPYSLNLTSSDYYLYQKLKKELRGEKYYNIRSGQVRNFEGHHNYFFSKV